MINGPRILILEMERRDPWLYCLWSLSPKSDRGKRHNFVKLEVVDWNAYHGDVRSIDTCTIYQIWYAIKYFSHQKSRAIHSEHVHCMFAAELIKIPTSQAINTNINVRMFRIIKRDFRENLFVLCVDCQLFFIKTTLWQSLRDYAVTAIFITTEY